MPWQMNCLLSPNDWNWSNGISTNIPYVKFSKVSCTGDNSNKLTCKAEGDASIRETNGGKSLPFLMIAEKIGHITIILSKSLTHIQN